MLLRSKTARRGTLALAWHAAEGHESTLAGRLEEECSPPNTGVLGPTRPWLVALLHTPAAALASGEACVATEKIAFSRTLVY
jgi:hypothetical protein